MAGSMTMRERILAILQGRELDRVPFVQYDGLAAPNEEVWDLLGRDRMGLIRWSAVHRAEHPNCRYETEEFERDGLRGQRVTLHTPAGSLFEERLFEPTYNTGSTKKHFVEMPEDYEALWAYLEDGIILEDVEHFLRDERELGEDGLPMVAVERTPYQQLWVQWTGLDHLSEHMVDCPDRVGRTVDLLVERERRIFDIVCDSPVPFVDFPDNITAPVIGPRFFQQYCVPLYDELAGRLRDRGVPVFVHMDGDLKPLWEAIGASGVRGLDSFSPAPDNDTTVSEAATMWPEMRLFVNFPSSVHIRPAPEVRAVAEQILEEAGHTGRLQIQLSENVPPNAWRTSLPAIAEAIEAFGAL